MLVFSNDAIEGFLYCLFVQQKPLESAYSELLEAVNSMGISNLLTWSFEDVQKFYTRAQGGDFKIQEQTEKSFQTLKGFIYCLVWLEAHGKPAPKSTLKINGMEIFSTNDVDLMYKKIYEGKYNMLEWKGVEYPAKLLLKNMPHLIQKQVVEYLGVEARFLFRSTSHQFRSLVDKTPLFIKKLSLTYGAKWIRIVSSDGFNVKYYRHFNEGDVILKRNKKCTELEDCGGFESQAMAQFRRILESKNLEIGELSIDECKCGCYENRRVFDVFVLTDDLISKTMKRLRTPPHVEKLSYHTSEFDNIHLFLEALNPEKIKSVEFTKNNTPTEFEGDGDPVYETEQWKRLENFISDQVFYGDERFARNFSHFNFAKFQLFEVFRFDQIVEMKKNLLRNPNLNQIKIQTRFNKKRDFKTFNRLMGTFNDFEAKDPVWAHFRYPGTKKNEKLSIMVTPKLIWFKGPKYVEDPDDVPFAEMDYTEWDDDDDNIDAVWRMNRF